MFEVVSSFLSSLPWWVWAVGIVLLLSAGFRDDRVGSAIVLFVGVGLIGTGLYGIWSSGIPQMTVASFINHSF